ncbi:telomeric DNA binding protein [Cryptosporidium ryanae]|uniref:telomeric DNA binding protein n=1 Tax=Cryptosporidium ryanae TaxID=515981 RepID=UPI00351A9827|nr:telomeric DNA binding protein [Cryptosporidium ryanae]
MDAKSEDNFNLNSIFFDTEETETEEYDEKLLERGQRVGMESLEWSLEFLTKNKNFLKGKSMSSMSLYAVYVWAGSQNSVFINSISTCGKIRNELLNYVIHPIHELINSLRNNEFYLMALTPENSSIFNSSVSRLYIREKNDTLKIPLITGVNFDCDFILNKIKLIYNHIILGSIGNVDKTCNSDGENSTDEDINIISNSIKFSDKVVDLCTQLNSVLIFHWLLLNILNNFLYSQNGPISMISFNILIEKLSLFFPKESGYSNELHRHIVHYYDLIRKIWMNVSSNNSVDDNILANYLNKYPSECEEFIGLLKQIYSKYPLDDLLYLLSDFISALNIDLDANILGKNDSNLNSPCKEPESVSNSDKSLPIEVDPQEPFNSIFELTGFIRASAICREFSQLLKPKEKFTENAVGNVRSILNYCIRKNKADLKYITDIECGKVNKNECEINTLSYNSGDLVESKNEAERATAEGENSTLTERRQNADDEDVESSATGMRSASNDSDADCENDTDSELDRNEQDENSRWNSRVIKLRKINLYSSAGKPSRKVSVKGISESSESCSSGESDGHSHKSDNFVNLGNNADSMSEHERPSASKQNRRSSRLKRIMNKRLRSDPESSSSKLKAEINEDKDDCDFTLKSNSHIACKKKMLGNRKSSTAEKVEANVLTPPNCVNNSRQYRRWSEEETSLLVNGVNKFGLGKWRFILATTKFESRDEVGLKDRWRNLVKGGHVVWDQRGKRYNLVRQ